MAGESLIEYYRLNHMLLFKLDRGQFTLRDLENMLPYERDIYVHLILQELKEEIERKANGN